eukprot:8772853-Pyramimonas_sp.AAC.1
MVLKRAKTEEESRSTVGLWTSLLVSVGIYFNETQARVARVVRDKRLFDTKSYKKRLFEDPRLLQETGTKAGTNCAHPPWRVSSSGNQCALWDFCT